MARWIMLTLRGSVWYYRRTIPLHLRPLMEGRRELWRSLRTSNQDEARLLSLKVGAEVEQHFQRLKRHASVVAARASRITTLSAEVAAQRLTDDGTRESAGVLPKVLLREGA